MHVGDNLYQLFTRSSLARPTLKTTAILLGICFWLGCGDGAPRLDAESWRQDLQQLRTEILERHPAPHRKTSAAEFDAAFDAAARRAEELSAEQKVVELMRLAALLGDGHTSFFPDSQQFASFNYLPIRLWVFEEGIYPIAVGQDFASCLHRRLVRVGDRDVGEAFNELSTLVGADNEVEYAYTVPDLLIRPELLAALGIVEAASTVRLGFEGEDGKLHELDFPVIPVESYDRGTQWIAARGDLGEIPSVWLRRLFRNELNGEHLREDYWFTELDPERAVYFEYNRSVYLEDAAALYESFDELFASLDAHPNWRLVIDLRGNSGGEPRTAERLIEGIRARPRLLERGMVRALLARRTYSAALTTAAQLRREANAMLIGEPSRGMPNCPSEGRDIVLEHCGAILSVSTQLLTRDSELGDAATLPLDRQIPLRYVDYRAGIDRALESALSDQESPDGE